MIFDCGECFYTKEHGYILCENHKMISRRAKTQYDELYDNCVTEIPIPTLGVHHWVLGPTAINTPQLHIDLEDLLVRSDIPVWDVFKKGIDSIKKTYLLPDPDKKTLLLLRNSDKALASFDFNGTFEIEGKFEKQIDEESLRSFMHKWNNTPGNKIEDLFLGIIGCIKLKRTQ